MGGRTIDTYAAKPRIEIDGNALPPEHEVQLERVIVDDHLGLPAMFLLRFRDPERDLLGRSAIRVGSQIRILAGVQGEEAADVLLDAEVTALEAEYDSSGSHAIARGFDVSHRLHRGRRTDTYRDVTDSEIARTVAQRAGLKVGRIDETSTTHRHVSQANSSDWDFLTQRAAEIGFELSVSNGELEFRAPASAADAPQPGDLAAMNPLQLVLGANLRSFRPRVTAADAVSEVQVRGWDSDNKRALVGRASVATDTMSIEVDAKSLAGLFGDPVYVGVDRPLTTQEEVDAVAMSLSDYVAGGVAEAEGTASGNPKLRAGSTVSVGLVGSPFEGVYTVTHSRHTFDVSGYRTDFAASGRVERSLLSLSGGKAPDGHGRRIDGVVIAQVTNASDESGLARVKLSFPWLSDTYESDWVRVVQPGAGSERGLLLVPEVNDEVLVSFEQGDFRRPYVIGGLYNGIDKPKIGSSELIDKSKGEVLRRGFISRKGHSLVLSDEDGGEGIDLLSADQKLRITLDQVETTILIKSDGSIEIKGGNDVSIKGKTIELSAESGVSIDGGAGNVTVKGTQIRLN